MCSSHPSSPTKFILNASVSARPIFTFLPDSQGNASLEKSSIETFCSNSRDLGPAITNTPILLVIFSKVTDLSFGSRFLIQS